MERRERDLRGRAGRALGVLAVLLGLLAMHGLVSRHHVPSVAPLVAAAAAATHHGAHGVEAAGTAAVAVIPGLAGAVDGACPDCAGHTAAVLCLAVLSAGLTALVVLVGRRSRTAGVLAPREHPVVRAGPRPLPRPPDPVAELCVSRT